MTGTCHLPLLEALRDVLAGFKEKASEPSHLADQSSGTALPASCVSLT